AEEDLPLRAGGADAHRPVRANDMLEHAGTDPVCRVGREARGALGIEAARRDGETEVSLLDEIFHRRTRMTELEGNFDDQAEVRRDEPRQRGFALVDDPGGSEAAFLVERQRAFAMRLGGRSVVLLLCVHRWLPRGPLGYPRGSRRRSSRR